jgi:hypothetical protein
MGTLHDLIERQGKQGALLLGMDRRAVEAAAAYMADEDTGMGFLYSGWCQAALPHRRLPDDEEWQIRSDYISLIVQPGLRSSSVGRAEKIGVPYGSRARLLMFYIQSEAIRTGSKEVHLGRSLNAWMLKMGISIGGKSMNSIRDQADRIARCSFTFDGKGLKLGRVDRMTIFDTAVFHDDDSIQASLFPQIASLSDRFFAQLTEHPVPLDEAAVRAISNNSMALDVYAWLSFRLHVLRAPTPVSWTLLMQQFGGGFSQRHHFRRTFTENLELALAVYRDANVDVTERGLTLHHSKPPVAPRLVAVPRSLQADRAKVQSVGTR